MFSENGVLGDKNLLDLFLRGGVIHDIQHDFFQYRPQAPSTGLLGERLAGHRSECALGESELYLFKREELFILFGEGVSGLSQNPDQGALVEFVERGNDR